MNKTDRLMLAIEQARLLKEQGRIAEALALYDRVLVEQIPKRGKKIPKGIKK